MSEEALPWGYTRGVEDRYLSAQTVYHGGIPGVCTVVYNGGIPGVCTVVYTWVYASLLHYHGGYTGLYASLLPWWVYTPPGYICSYTTLGIPYYAPR